MIFTVAIDGPAAAGKGTIARAVAAHFGFRHLDTGLLYRAVGLRARAGEDPVSAARGLTAGDVARSDLRTVEAGRAAARVATDPAVRAALRDFQRAFARTDGGAVLDGRDIGTVICPDADVKLYVTATDSARARRRWRDFGGAQTEAEVAADLAARDARDSTRAVSPLRRAADALLLDTTDLSIDAGVAEAVRAVEARLRARHA